VTSTEGLQVVVPDLTVRLAAYASVLEGHELDNLKTDYADLIDCNLVLFGGNLYSALGVNDLVIHD
jgi:hypothetical protein